MSKSAIKLMLPYKPDDFNDDDVYCVSFFASSYDDYLFVLSYIFGIWTFLRKKNEKFFKLTNRWLIYCFI